MRQFLVAFLLCAFCAFCGQAQPFSKKYLMAFHTCTTNCGDPRSHTTWLAESDDGAIWSPVPNAPSFASSVPDLIIRGERLYIFSPGRVTRYDRRTNVWRNPVNVLIRDAQGQMIPFVDPSPIVDANGRIVLFFLRGNTPGEGDPASCSTYPCLKYFGSAVEVAGTDGTEFVLQPGWRAQVTLTTGTIADPDIFSDGKQYVLYLSAGNNTWAYSGNELHGSYQPIPGLPNSVLTTNGGGVPSGHFDAATNKYWTYAHTFEQGRTIIRRAVTDSLTTPIAPSQFTTIITGTTVGLDSTASAASPGFTLNTWLTTGSITSVSAASFQGARLAPESICAAYGDKLALGTFVANTTPLPTALSETSLRVVDSLGVERVAPLFFVSPTQVNFQLPMGLATGTATATIVSGDGVTSGGRLEIAPVAPGLFAANANGRGPAAAVALRVKPDGSQQFEPVTRFDSAQNRAVAVPLDLGAEAEQLFLLLFGTGIRFRSQLAAVGVTIGGVATQVSFAGAQGELFGLDQLNVRLPRNLIGRGEVEVVLTIDGQTANIVTIAIK